jgi:hypothetical protein
MTGVAISAKCAHEAQIAIDGPRVLNGYLPPRALGLAMEWAAIHAEELLIDWELASTRQPLHRIAPLGQDVRTMLRIRAVTPLEGRSVRLNPE